MATVLVSASLGSLTREHIERASISVANAGSDGTGTIVDTFTAGANGSWLSSLEITAQVTTTAGMVRIFIHDGSSWKIYDEVVVTAITKAASTAGFRYTYTPPNAPLKLPAGWKVGTAPHNGETFVIVARGGDY